MKLGMIDHARCGERTFDRTLVWLPDDMSDEAFEKAVNAARDEYLAFAIRFKDEPPPNDYRQSMMIPFSKYPELTVAQVQADWAAKKVVWEAWDEERKKARRTFGNYIGGRDGIKRFWEVEPEHTYECDWGHHHGVQIDYAAERYD